jgi:hypothetical protein
LVGYRGPMRAAIILALVGMFLATPLDPQPCSGSRVEQCKHAPECTRYIMLMQRPAWEMDACSDSTRARHVRALFEIFRTYLESGHSWGMCVAKDPVINLWRDTAFLEFLDVCEKAEIWRCETAGTCPKVLEAFR